MRATGFVDSAGGLAPRNHLCWAFQDRAEFRLRAAEYLAAAVASGQRVEYVGSGSTDGLRGELAGLAVEGLGGAVDRVGVGVSAVDDFYELSGERTVVNPAASVAARASAAEAAIAAGYTGLAVVVDATAMVRTPEQRDAFARYEYLLDQQATGLPISALCAYDLGRLGSPAAAELACLHPLASHGSSPFRLYAEAGAEFALAGEVDLSCAELFATTLGRAVSLSTGPELVVDLRGLEFIDHRGLLALAESARCRDATVVLVGASSSVARVTRILGLTDVRVEAA